MPNEGYEGPKGEAMFGEAEGPNGDNFSLSEVTELQTSGELGPRSATMQQSG